MPPSDDPTNESAIYALPTAPERPATLPIVAMRKDRENAMITAIESDSALIR